MKKMMSCLWEEEVGQGLVEYSLILVIIAVVVAIVMNGTAEQLNGFFIKTDGAFQSHR